MDTTGIVFDIQRFSLHDGPGIRTTVFLKGCHLRCLWCHNPESMEAQPQTITKPDGTQHTFGRVMTVDSVMAVLEKDAPYYRKSGGGITLSGGEPMFQLQFTKALLQTCQARGWHTCLDTSGFAGHKAYEAVMPFVDLFLFDIKAHNTAVHTQLTGRSSARILENLCFLYQSGAAIRLRCPLVPGVNDSLAHLRFISDLSEKYPHLEGIEIMPYHSMAAEKWRSLGMKFVLEGKASADDAVQKTWLETLHSYGCAMAKIG